MFSIFHFVRKWPKSNKTKLSKKKIRLSKLQLSSQTWTNKTIQSSGFCIDHFFSKFYFFTFIYDLLAIFFSHVQNRSIFSWLSPVILNSENGDVNLSNKRSHQGIEVTVPRIWWFGLSKMHSGCSYQGKSW